MGCDCIKNFNKLLKEKFNETATVNCEVLSGTAGSRHCTSV